MLRRLTLVVPVTVLAALLAAPPAAASSRKPDFFRVPGSAYVRPLGEIPSNPASTNGANGDPAFAAGRGAALGGIGAGSFMYNQAGTFGPWELRPPLHEERILAQAAFHVRERLGASAPVVRTLATPGPLGSVMSGWRTLSPGDGTYAALYPFGWTTYHVFHADVSMRFWSPIVAREDKPSSLPLASFDVRIANHTSKVDRVSVMFTFPNAPLCVNDPNRPCTRTGFNSRVNRDPRTGVLGVTLGAHDPSNVLDAQDTEWTIATRPAPRQSVSYTTSWDAAGDGGTVYARFRAGDLGDRPLDTSHSAGAIMVTATIRPGSVATIPFALAWDFPRTLFGSPDDSHTVWMKRYTSFYGAEETKRNDYVPDSYPFHRGFHIADEGLAQERRRLASVLGWWGRVVFDHALPTWLRRAALNELYYDAFGGSFWESGLVENTYPCASDGGCSDRVGSQVPGTHLFFDLESPEYRLAESYDVRAYQARQFDLLFPHIERDVQRAWTEFVLRDPSGRPPHDAGSPFVSPYIAYPAYGQSNAWLDLPMKYIAQVWQYVRETGDRRFLRLAYPAMMRSYQYVRDQIPQGEHLPTDNGIDNTYDTWTFSGHTSYVSGLWILAEEAMAAATRTAARMHVRGASPQFASGLHAEIAQARAEYEADLWDASQGYYRIDTGSSEYGDGVMADATFAQHVAEALGLPDVVSIPQHLRRHLVTSFRYLVQPWHDTKGRCLGAANGVNADGSEIRSGSNQADEVWTGVTYFYAATQYLDGVRFHDPRLKRFGLRAARCVEKQTYEYPDTGYAFDTPEAWLITDASQHRALQYSRPRSVWELVLAIGNPFPWGLRH